MFESWSKKISTDYLIIGGSFAGSLLAAELNQYGKVVLVDRCIPGSLLNCGGGLPRDVFQNLSINIPSVKIDKMIFHFDEKEISFSCDYVVIDRAELDKKLLKKALAGGCKFLQGNYQNSSDENIAFFDNNRKERVISYKKIIFSNGINPCKNVLNFNKRIPKKSSGISYNEIIEQNNVENNVINIYLDREIGPGYAWVFPMPNQRINIGVGFLNERRFDPAFFKKFKKKNGIDGKILKKGGGHLPLFPETRVSLGNRYLFGDAAGMVYALNGEGLKYIAEMTKIWANAIKNSKSLNSHWIRSRIFAKLFFGAICLKILLGIHKMTKLNFYGIATKISITIKKKLEKIKT
ncbi:MAG: hypothetical protein U9O87_01785 [Verrucomicrobiota bacterium]|nr:hypothetical protein [Verrucomicrobiota bacterium]